MKREQTRLRTVAYRLNQRVPAQARAYALTRARRCAEERSDFVNALVRPVGKKKWNGKKKGNVVFAHYCLPLWLEGTVVEETKCGAENDLVLLKMSMKPAVPAFFVKSRGDLRGGRDPSTPGRIPRIPLGKMYVAVPKKDLWMSK